MNSGSRTALILGVSGQDGAYLAKLLLGRGYRVHGTSRNAAKIEDQNLKRLGILNQITLHSLSPIDFRNTKRILDALKPDEIYNLAAQSSVGLSFSKPMETIRSNILGTVNILEGARSLKLDSRIFNACSGDCFGDVDMQPADEATPFRPRSPYATAKAAAHWAVVNYRECYGLFACSGILFNHESPLRSPRFVTKKVISGAIDIAERRRDRLELGNLSIVRDWGWAPEYVEAMHRILALDTAEDFVIATGVGAALGDFVERAFTCLGLRWQDHVRLDEGMLRPTDLSRSIGNPSNARATLGWQARTKMPELVDRLIEAELAERRG